MNRLFTAKNIVAVLLSAAVLFCYHAFFTHRARVQFDISVTKSTLLKVYWKKADGNFSESNRVQLKLHPDRSSYRFFLTNLAHVDQLRIDPIQYKGEAVFQKMVIRQPGYKNIIIASAADFATLAPNPQLQVTKIDENGIHLLSEGRDPFFLYSPEIKHPGIGSTSIGYQTGCSLLLILLCFLTVYSTFHLAERLRYLTLMLPVALILIVSMSALSNYNTHPDESMHWAAINYYQNHWMPPDYKDPAIRHTYSGYGASRLNMGEVYYDVAGKFKRMIDDFHLPDNIQTRLFNNLLFALIVLLAIRNFYARLAAIPLIISPQIWYLFSYANSDCFAIFIAYLLGVQLLDPESSLNLSLRKRFSTGILARMVFLGLLLGTMFLLKKNYYFYIAFFYLYLGLIILFRMEREERKRAVLRMVCMTLLGGLLFSLRVGMDYKVNGMDKTKKFREVREEYAEPMYKKASIGTTHQFRGIFMKAAGVPFTDLITKERWFEKSFRSSFGEYGYKDVTASEGYYNIVRYFALGGFIFLFGSIFIRGDNLTRVTGLLTLGLGATLTGIALYHSWLMDFQAQGRYLFPMAGMLGILIGSGYRYLNRRLLTLFVTLLFVLSTYSFLFIALAGIRKV